MKRYSVEQRVKFYGQAYWDKYAESAPWIGGQSKRMYCWWFLGQDYRSKSGYYGSYPPQYLNRIMAFYPDVKHEECLHLFSGSLPKGTLGMRVDVNPDTSPDIIADAHALSHFEIPGPINLILADPPYSAEDAERYGTIMIKRNIVLRECAEVLEPGGYLVWLDQALPMYSKATWILWGVIAIMRSTNHRFRCVTILKRRR